jgi:hypothetical protein
MVRKIAFTICFVLLSVSSMQANERRVALVVGVADYKHAPRLINTENDARDMAGALGRLGFEVELVLNPDRLAFEAAVRRLGQRSRGADASLFYYAGHALEVSARNWLLPSSAELKDTLDLRFEALDIDTVVEQTSGGARVSLIFLDACRDNPFRNKLMSGGRSVATRGLGRIDASEGTLVVYATAPGTVAQDGKGRNSPFTAALLRHIDRPNLDVRQLLSEVRREVRQATGGRQIPWENSALEGPFFFRPAAPAVSPASARPNTGTAAAQTDLEVVFWDSVRTSGDAADIRAYLARFPDGVFAGLARRRLEQLPRGPGSRVTPQQAAAAAPAVQPPTPAPRLQDAVSARLATAVPTLAEATRARVAAAYEEAKAHKAQAASLRPPGTWRTTNRGSSHDAAEAALESCQVAYGNACVLVAIDDRPQDPADGKWLGRDMPRARYDGYFNPDRIPGAPPSSRRRADLAGYSTAAAPKAAALHPAGGRVVTVTGASSQRAAEEQVLETCNAERSRTNAGGPCFLYAVGTKIVLPQRLTEPRRPAATIGEAIAVVGSRSTAELYAAAPGQKALAIEPESGRAYRYERLKTAAQAEQLALEACQLRYGRPCILMASNDELRAPDPYAAARHDMPRIKYEGPLKMEMVPFRIAPSPSKLLRDYASLKKSKALAVGLSPTRFRIGEGKTAAEAEAMALGACNEPDATHPCFLYAVGDVVVLPKRRTEPGR